MLLLATEVAIRLEVTHSLKEKRQVAKRLIDRIWNRYPVAIAETDHQDDHRLLVLGIAALGNERRHVERLIDRCLGVIAAEGHDFWPIERSLR